MTKTLFVKSSRYSIILTNFYKVEKIIIYAHTATHVIVGSWDVHYYVSAVIVGSWDVHYYVSASA